MSVLHLPSKALRDIPHFFSQENVPVLFTGTVATAWDWGGYDNRNTLAGSLAQWNARPLFDFGNFYGEGWVEGGAALGSWTLGAFTDDRRLQQFGRDATESIILSTLLVTGVKVSVNRTRPNGGDYSFPSGHSITAFCVAPVVQKYWGWEAGAPAYLLAAVTGLARIEGHYHYLSDVIAGAALGVVIGNAVVYSPEDLSMSVGPGQMEIRWSFN